MRTSIFFLCFCLCGGLMFFGAQTARADEISRTIAEWKALTDEDQKFSFARYAAFLAAHSDFPRTRQMRAAAERVIPPDVTPAQVLAFYKQESPVTAAGMRAYLTAARRAGRTHAAYQTLKTWYTRAFINTDDQAEFLAAYRSVLFPHVAHARFDYLVETEQMDRAAAMADLIGGDYPVLVRALSARGHRIGDSEVSQEMRFYPALVAARLSFYRQVQKSDRAADYFLSIPGGQKMSGPQQKLAAEHQNLVYDLLDNGRPVDAYRVATRVIYTDPDAAAQSLWMAGYVAMDHLHQPGRAFRAFEKLYKVASSPLTRARAAYYAGRASEALHYSDVAQAWYRISAGYRGNFYGQIAQDSVSAQSSKDDVTPFGPPVAMQAIRDPFYDSDRVRAARKLAQGGDKQNARAFLSKMAEDAGENGGELRLVVDLARSVGDMPMAVKLSRLAAKKGIDFSDYMYPTAIKVQSEGVEPALIYAVIRQESGFDSDAVSPSGARGLMQLMPATAAEMASRADLQHRVSWLTARPDHNIRLGVAYLARLLKKYEGSYVLATAAYNAGPSRVDEWIADYGDPRRGKISVAAWSERIPFSETRNYVQRVLEGAHIYRRLFGWSYGSANLDALHLEK